ncbi:MAG: AAA family ATPase [Nitrosopumilaceae archaeon]
MRILFTGTHGAGKSTLVEALAKLDEFKDYYISTNLTRHLAKRGYKINQQGNAATQTAIMTVHRENAERENLIADRCAIDCFCYTLYLIDNEKLDKEGMAFLQELTPEIERICKKYDFVFYLTPEFPLTGDEIRPDSEQFQLDIQRIFEETIPYFNEVIIPSKIIPISGTIEERVQQILEKIHADPSR